MPAVIVLVIIGFALGLIIGIVVKLFGAEIDPRLEATEGLLPGANCGACGFAGCADFARALVAGSADPGLCPSAPSAAVQEICALLGLQAGDREAKVALIACGGDDDKAQMQAFYNGVLDCKDAALVAGGVKGCAYGCLGLGTCARACPFDAIEITPKGIAVVHPELCTGCGKCVATCPRSLIKLVPEKATVHVLCNSPAKGAAKRKVCKAACIGCRKCVKAAGEDQIIMNGFLAVVNYDSPPDAAVAGECPTKCLVAGGTTAEADVQQEVVNG